VCTLRLVSLLGSLACAVLLCIFCAAATYHTDVREAAKGDGKHDQRSNGQVVEVHAASPVDKKLLK